MAIWIKVFFFESVLKETDKYIMEIHYLYRFHKICIFFPLTYFSPSKFYW